MNRRPNPPPAPPDALRRRLGLSLASAAGMVLAPRAEARRGTAPAPSRPLLRPRALRRGDVVALIAPGGYVDDALIEKGVRNLESLGLRVLTARHLRARHGGYAGTVRERLLDLHALFERRDVAALWALRGGSGCAALLPHLRYELIRRARKLVIGYSDISALTAAIVRHARLVCCHGPVASSTFSDYSLAQIEALLFDAVSHHAMQLAQANVALGRDNAEYRARTVHAGTLRGRLAGGNLSVISALVGTPYAPQFHGALVFLEEIGEAPYRIERMLTQLTQSGAFESAGGILLGVFRNCSPRAGDVSLSLAETIDEQLGALDVPSVYGYSFGHIAQQYTLPLGVEASVDPTTATVTLHEAATVRE